MTTRDALEAGADYIAFGDRSLRTEIRQEAVAKIYRTQLMAVIPSGVENGAAWEAATWTGKPKAERVGSERIKSLDALKSQMFSTSLDMTQGYLLRFSFIHDDTRAFGGDDMAIDESAARARDRSIDRFYKWHSPALSFGYLGNFRCR